MRVVRKAANEYADGRHRGPRPRIRLRRWVFEPLPLARVAVLRVFVYLFVVYDMFFVVADPPALSRNSDLLYRPIDLREILHLPTPFPGYVYTLRFW